MTEEDHKVLPFDCISVILTYLPLVDAINAAIAFVAPIDAKRLIEYRKSTIRLFSDLIENPRSLILCMQRYGCVASGARVSEYFRPDLRCDNSDWNFLVSGNGGTESMIKELNRLGVEWEDSLEFEVGALHDRTDIRVWNGTVNGSKKTRQRIRLVDTGDSNPINILMSFHSTPVQCFVDGFFAVHLYGRLTALSKRLVWHGTNRNRVVWIRNRNDAICILHGQSLRSNERLLYSYLSMENVQETREELRTMMAGYYNTAECEPNIATAAEISRFTSYVMGSVADGTPFLKVNEIVNSVLSGTLPGRLIGALIASTCTKCTCIIDSTLAELQLYSSSGYADIRMDEYRANRRWHGIHPEWGGYRIRRIGDSDTTVIPLADRRLEAMDSDLALSAGRLLTYTWAEFSDRTATPLDAFGKNLMH